FEAPAQAMAVRRDKDALARLKRRNDRLLVIRDRARDRVLQAFRFRYLDPGIAAITAHAVGVVVRQRRRRNVVGPAPDLDLLGSDLVDHLLLVEPGEPAIVALIQPPVL